MPLSEVSQPRHLSASIRLTDTTAAQVDRYAAFLHVSADQVVENALAYVFSTDHDFYEFLKSTKRKSSRLRFAFATLRQQKRQRRPKRNPQVPR